MCSYAIGHQLPRSDLPRFTFPRSSTIRPPQFVSYRVGYARIPLLRASLNDLVSEERQSMSFYELLGIPQTGSLTEIKHAYKQLARKYHPDVSPPDRVEEFTHRFIRVQEAYETLSDPTMRELYDRDMAKGLHLSFTARTRSRFHKQMDEKSEWKPRWQSQLSELKKRRMQKDSDDNMSWGARMRRERNEQQ